MLVVTVLKIRFKLMKSENALITIQSGAAISHHSPWVERYSKIYLKNFLEFSKRNRE